MIQIIIKKTSLGIINENLEKFCFKLQNKYKITPLNKGIRNIYNNVQKTA